MIRRLLSVLYRTDEAVGGLREEAGFRARLAWLVLRGRVPYAREALRDWNSNKESPIALSICDWTSSRTLALLLVPPPLEEKDLYKARRLHHERAEQLLRAFLDGAVDRLWTTGVLREDIHWDSSRRCWVVGADEEQSYVLEGSWGR